MNTTVPSNGYGGFNLHIHANVGAGVTLTAINGSSVGSIVSVAGDSSDLFCTSAQAIPERVYACAGLAGQDITTAGKLARFNLVVAAGSSGCIVANLVLVPGDATSDTYTVDSATSSVQSNVVSLATVNLLYGSGTTGNCPGGTLPTNTPVPAATNTTVPAATNTPVPAPTNTPVPAPTNTTVPGPTTPPTNTPTRTNTPAAATNTPTRTPTRTPTNTAVAVGSTNTATSTPVTPPGGCPDLDDDGSVGDSDVVEAAHSFGSHHGDDNFNHGADRDRDNRVSVVDLVRIAKHHGQACHDDDHDGVSDDDEEMDGTDPHGSDSDGDNYTDGEESRIGKSGTLFCKVMRSDLDKDHQVSIVDLSRTAAVYQTAAGGPRFKATSDFDHDSRITILDLSYQASTYGKRVSTCP